MRGQSYDLLEQLKYASPLGPMLRGIRISMQVQKSRIVGLNTIRKLEEAGVASVEKITRMTLLKLKALGVNQRLLNRSSSIAPNTLSLVVNDLRLGARQDLPSNLAKSEILRKCEGVYKLISRP